MIKFLVVLMVTISSNFVFAQDLPENVGIEDQEQSVQAEFSFLGHVTLKNDLPEPLQVTIFEGDFQQGDADDRAGFAASLAEQGLTLESDVYYTIQDGKPGLILAMVGQNGKSSVLVLDIAQGEKFIYEVAERSEKRLVIGRVAFQSDLILEVK